MSRLGPRCGVSTDSHDLDNKKVEKASMQINLKKLE